MLLERDLVFVADLNCSKSKNCKIVPSKSLISKTNFHNPNMRKITPGGLAIKIDGDAHPIP